MEVTTLAKQAVVLLFFCSVNGYGHGPLQISQAVASQSHISPIVGYPQASIIVQKLSPSVYSHSHTNVLSQQYPAGFNNVQSLPIPNCFQLLFASVRNSGYFVLSVLGLTDADRYNSLRESADNLNAAIDCAWNTLTNFYNTIKNILNTISDIPILGFIVQIFEELLYVINYIPLQIIKAVGNMLRDTFRTKSPQYSGYPAAAGAYAYF